MKKYLFSYGSLINKESRDKTLPSRSVIGSAKLLGYKRAFGVPIDGRYLAINLVPNKTSQVEGILIEIFDGDFPNLAYRERGYSRVDVTDLIDIDIEGRAYCYIGPNREYPKMVIPQSYIDACLYPLSEQERKRWISETVIKNKVIDDCKDPIYEFASGLSATQQLL